MEFLSSAEEEDDGATTMGSPIPAAQSLASSPSVNEASAWIPRRTSAAQTRRLDDLFAAVATVTQDDDGDAKEQEKEEDSQGEQPTDRLLSPASQLHVLSQISELAARERPAQKPTQVTRPPHAWAPIAQRTQPPEKVTRKRKATTTSATTKKQRGTNTIVGVGLLADVATWDAFDEPIFEGSDADEDAWSFDELSDSDF